MTTPQADPPPFPSPPDGSDDRYRELFEHSVAGMYSSSAEGRLLEANQAMADILGYDSIEELFELDLGREVYADPSARDRLLEQVERDGIVRDFEMELRRKDGSPVMVSGSLRGIRDENGRLATMQGTLVDISQRVRAARDLQRSEQRYRHLVENLTDGVFETTPDGRMLRANQALIAMLGYDSEEELLAVPVSELYAEPGSRDERIAEALAKGGVRNEELLLRRKDGRLVYCLQNARVVYDDTQAPRFEGTLTDLSELRRREAERHQLEARRKRQNQALLDLTREARPQSIEESWRQVAKVAARTLEVERVGIWLFEEGNRSIRNVSLWERSEERFSSGEILSAAERPVYFKALREERAIAADDAVSDPRTAEFADDYLVPNSISSMLDVPIRTGGKVVGILCHEHVGVPRQWSSDEIDFAASIAGWLSQEIERHDRLEMQEELRSSERKYRDLFESTVSGFFRIDQEGDFLAANPAFLEMLGYASQEELRGVNLARDIYVDRGKRPSLAAAIREVPLLRNVESELRRRDGSIIRVFGNIRRVDDKSGETLHYEGSFVDVTERAELELQLRQSQKMEALGKLAGGVAHDFNNLITVMLGYIDLAASKVDPASSLLGDLEQIRDAADRAAAMTRHLLAYTRQQVLHPQVVDLNASVEDVSQLLDRMIGEDIVLDLDLGDDLAPVRVDPGQLQQVMINLAVNARDAMPRGGRLTVRTRSELLEADRRMPDFVIEPGRYSVVTVVDEGEGMDEDTRSHALEPFFTTKPVGEGTGLGLSTAYGIVKQSGGYISIESRVGKGTEIDIYLPSSTDGSSWRVAGSREAPEEPEESATAPHQTVLLVEDDPTLRRLTTSVLEGEGYRILAPDSPEEALTLAEGDESLDLLLTDVVMPGLSGLELAARVREKRPELPVLFISGYPSEFSSTGSPFESAQAFLGKPFGPHELTKRVRELLEASPPD